MKRETYRGVRLAVKKGREWGYLTWIVNGEPWGDWLGRDESAAIEQMKRYVDAAAERPDSSPIFEPPTARRTSALEDSHCDCDAADTRHGLHRADCAYIREVDRLRAG